MQYHKLNNTPICVTTVASRRVMYSFLRAEENNNFLFVNVVDDRIEPLFCKYTTHGGVVQLELGDVMLSIGKLSILLIFLREQCSISFFSGQRKTIH